MPKKTEQKKETLMHTVKVIINPCTFVLILSLLCNNLYCMEKKAPIEIQISVKQDTKKTDEKTKDEQQQKKYKDITEAITALYQAIRDFNKNLVIEILKLGYKNDHRRDEQCKISTKIEPCSPVWVALNLALDPLFSAEKRQIACEIVGLLYQAGKCTPELQRIRLYRRCCYRLLHCLCSCCCNIGYFHGFPLHKAALCNDVELIKIIVQHDKKAINQEGDSGWTAFMQAGSVGNRAATDLLLALGAEYREWQVYHGDDDD